MAVDTAPVKAPDSASAKTDWAPTPMPTSARSSTTDPRNGYGGKTTTSMHMSPSPSTAQVSS